MVGVAGDDDLSRIHATSNTVELGALLGVYRVTIEVEVDSRQDGFRGDVAIADSISHGAKTWRAGVEASGITAPSVRVEVGRHAGRTATHEEAGGDKEKGETLHG